MTEFVSQVQTIPHDDATVFRVLSDLRKLESMKDQIPSEKIKDFSFDENSVSFRVDPIGKVTFLVVAREPEKLIKYQSEKLPFDVFMWIQLVTNGAQETKLRMTVKADLNPFIRGMAEKPMKEAVNQISEMLARLPYDRL